VERRTIAIQMLPKAYDEIQRLKGEETWTRFIIRCVLAKVGDNSTLKDELASLPEPKEPKPKAEKKAKVKKATKVKKAVFGVPGKEEEPSETELKAIEEAGQ